MGGKPPRVKRGQPHALYEAMRQCNWSSAGVAAMRDRLRLDRRQFANLLGVDVRSVYRWEDHTVKALPTGASSAVLAGLREKLDKDPSDADKVTGIIADAVAMGGLAYLIVKLLDSVTRWQASDSRVRSFRVSP